MQAVSAGSAHPRVLIVEHTPFNWHSCTGILKSRLFFGWPKERLAQVVYSNDMPAFDVCEQYWRLSKLGILKGLLGRTSRSALAMPASGTNHTEVFQYDSRPRIERMFGGLDERWRVPIGEGIFRLPRVASKPLRQWVDAFNPDVIFSTAGTAAMLRVAVKIARWRQIPIVPYYTDDWISTQYEQVLFGQRLKRSLRFWFRQCLLHSAVRLTSCDQMKIEYSQRYGGDFETLLFPEPPRQGLESAPPASNRNILRLVYIGSIALDRWRSLRAIGEALRDLRQEGVKGELLIYTFPCAVAKFGRELTLDPVMRVVGHALPEEVPGLQSQADVLVHVESFDPMFRRWTRLSLSTKIPQYLTAGKCIFAYGPAEIASMQYLSAAKAAVSANRDSPEILRAALRQLIANPEMRQRKAARAGTAAAELHDDSRQRERFRAALVRGCTCPH